MSKYFPYFHESYFLYTGERNSNKLIMRFEKEKLMEYVANDFTHVQKFADHAYLKVSRKEWREAFRGK
ncbi:MAG TPA: hypothetical protein VHD83_22850 [Puia sp.]|nr:hypothetical protein [Puia sp.]